MDKLFMKFSRLSLLAFVVLVLPSCTSSGGGYFSAGSPQVAAPPDNVSAMLAQAADRAATSLESLAAVEAKRTPLPSSTAPIADVPSGLSRAITIQWVGPVEPITNVLASRAGYKYSALGSSPPTDIIVTVDAENTPVIEVLRSIGLQMGARADIQVDAQQEIVEIVYASDTPKQ